MLYKRRAILFKNKEVRKTPMLVPSFSSKGLPDIGKFISTMADFITGPILVSAYDIFHGEDNEKIVTPIVFPELIFLDSGGYETSREHEILEPYYNNPKAKKWDEEIHKKVVSNWRSNLPTIVISYDHPKSRMSLADQVANATLLFDGVDAGCKEFLIKPETETSHFIDMKVVLENIRQLTKFDIIGFTEKELGNSVLNRMVNIARIREAITKAGSDCPIHIFGNLDPVTTPLYYFSGADIFDGLTWIRFAFSESDTIYQGSHGALQFNISTHDKKVQSRIWANNTYCLTKLEGQMRDFSDRGDYKVFGKNAKFFEESVNSMNTLLKEE